MEKLDIIYTEPAKDTFKDRYDRLFISNDNFYGFTVVFSRFYSRTEPTAVFNIKYKC